MYRVPIIAVLLAAGFCAKAQSSAAIPVGENLSLTLMREAWKHASQHGASQHPVISPNYPDIFAGMVPIEELHREGFQILPGTTSDEKDLRALIKAGADGMITDRPDVLQRIIAEELPSAADNETKARLKRFDIQGHRGARGLRPENTLPAYEEALNLGITTIEMDTGVTSDKVSSVWHDQFLNPRSCRRIDGSPYTEKDKVYFSDVTLAQLQEDFICDKTYFASEQKNDRSLSPVAVAFAKKEGLPDAYSPMSLGQVFQFVKFYESYYRSGLGKRSPESAFRVRSARSIRFDIETKLIPDYLPKDRKDPTVVVRTANHTVGPQQFVDVLLKTIYSNHMQGRCEVESFDFRTLHIIEEQYPKVPTYYLTGNRQLFP